MPGLSFLVPHHRPAILWNATDHGVQVARLGPADESPWRVDELAELASGDDEALARWLRQALPERGKAYVPAYCGIHPIDRVLARDSINTRRLAEPDYLPQVLLERAKVSTTADWHVAALHPIEGDVLTPEAPSRPGLVVGVPLAVVRETQQRLRRLRIRPQRLELGSVALLGAVTRYVRETGYPHATVVCEIGLGHTRVYFLTKDGVHTPPTLPHGLLSIMESTMKELGAPGIGAARDALLAPSDELRGHSRRLVRMLTRHLKPAVDYFEMQTGQPIGALFCAHLPAKLGWLEEALGAAIDLEFLVPDPAVWSSLLGLDVVPGAAPLARSWLQPLSLIGALAPLNHGAKA